MIEEVINQVDKAIGSERRRTGQNARLDIVIFMAYEFWYECMHSIHGDVRREIYEFYTEQTILGYPVFRVASHQSDRKAPPYTVHVNKPQQPQHPLYGMAGPY